MGSRMIRYARDRRGAVMALCAATWFGAACSDASDATGPVVETPGALTVQWVTPHNVEGAVRLRIAGPGITGIVGVQDDVVVFTRTEGKRHNVAILGRTETGGLVRFQVPDIQRADLYTVSLIEVAAPESSELRENLNDYRIIVE